MDTLFLDANVLVSAAWGPNTRMQQFWTLENVRLVTSTYAVTETERRLKHEEQIQRFRRFSASLSVVRVWAHIHLPDWVSIREKDVPIVQAAIAAQATHLVTGDARDFGDYFGQVIEGVEVIQPAEYLRRHSQGK